MATSPLFGWEEPDDTDLVKDGAAAIRTLGNAIDTSMGDLLGGTSGQVLSKNSNTNMDFTWVTSDDANAIQNTIVDAKGDLIGATAADTPARLAVGTNGQVLTADSTAATGLKWAAATSGLTLIKRSTFTNVATTTTTFDGVFTSSYKAYYIVIEQIAPTAGARINLLFQYRVAGTTQNAASYYGGFAGFSTPSGTSNASWDSGSTSARLATMETGGSVTLGQMLVTKVGNSSEGPMQSGTFYSQSPGSPLGSGGSYNVAIVADGFILSASSNFTGTAAVYGLASA